MDFLKMYFLLNMLIFHPAMLVYQRVHFLLQIDQYVSYYGWMNQNQQKFEFHSDVFFIFGGPKNDGMIRT